METGEIILWGLTALFAIWAVRRAWLQSGWQAQGRCYLCGRALGQGWKQLKLISQTVEYVDICGRCARRRRIWKRLLWGAVLAICALIWAYQVHG